MRMSKHSDEIVRQDIINAGELILEFTEGFDKRTFNSETAESPEFFFFVSYMLKGYNPPHNHRY